MDVPKIANKNLIINVRDQLDNLQNAWKKIIVAIVYMSHTMEKNVIMVLYLVVIKIAELNQDGHAQR